MKIFAKVGFLITFASAGFLVTAPTAIAAEEVLYCITANSYPIDYEPGGLANNITYLWGHNLPSPWIHNLGKSGMGNGAGAYYGLRYGSYYEPCAVPTANVIKNPSLETASPSDPSTPEGWKRGGWGTNTRVFTYPVLNTGSQEFKQAAEYAKAAKVEITSYASGDAKWYFDYVPVKPGETYAYSEYFNANVPSLISVQFRMNDGTFTYHDIGSGTGAVGDMWQQARGSFTVPANANALTVFHVIKQVGYLVVDGYSLVPVASLQPDTSIPDALVVSPAAGAKVSGVVQVTVEATDFGTIEGVKLTQYCGEVSGEDKTAPYQFTWDTTKCNNGEYDLQAQARDSAGHLSNPLEWHGVTVENVAQSNLIANASMETSGNDGGAAVWFKGGWGTNSRTLTYPVAGRNGGNASRVDVTSYASGDAKWYFASVPVTAGQVYSFSDYYMSNVPSSVGVQLRNSAGVFSYLDLGSAPASPAAWSQKTGTFTVPAGITSLTIFHVISQVGFLVTDDYSLTLVPAAPGNLIANASVETAGTGGTPAAWSKGGWGDNTRLFTYPVTGNGSSKGVRVEITAYASGDAKWYFDPVAVTPGKTYEFSDYYSSNVPTLFGAQFRLADGTYKYAEAVAAAASPAGWQRASASYVAPANAVSMTVFHVLPRTGWLVTDDFSLNTSN